MRQARTLFLIAIAATVVTAIVGATSASAVTYCKENKNPCPAGQRYAKETVFTAKLAAGTEASFTTTTFVARCSASTVELKSKEESGTPLLGTIPAFSFGPAECEGCKKAIVPLLPYNTELQEVGGKWQMTVKSGGSGMPRFRLIECPPGAKEECTFGETSYNLEVTGGKPASVAAKKVPLNLLAGSIPNCALTMAWNATYEIVEATEPGQKGVTTPPVWVTEKP